MLGIIGCDHPSFSGSHYLTRGWTKDQVGDLVFYGAMGVILGGRLGYVLFYNFGKFLDDPIWLFKLWDGGMSFHGGLLGVLSLFLFWLVRISRMADGK